MIIQQSYSFASMRVKCYVPASQEVSITATYLSFHIDLARFLWAWINILGYRKGLANCTCGNKNIQNESEVTGMQIEMELANIFISQEPNWIGHFTQLKQKAENWLLPPLLHCYVRLYSVYWHSWSVPISFKNHHQATPSHSAFFSLVPGWLWKTLLYELSLN